MLPPYGPEQLMLGGVPTTVGQVKAANERNLGVLILNYLFYDVGIMSHQSPPLLLRQGDVADYALLMVRVGTAAELFF